MITWHILPPEELMQVHQKAFPTLPDRFKDPNTFANIYGRKDSFFCAVLVDGALGGSFWFINTVPGWKATAHICLWDKACLKQCDLAREILFEVLRILNVRRVDAYIPAHNTLALRFAEELGLMQEGVLRQTEFYNGQLEDMVVYALLKEEDDGWRTR